MKAKDIYIYSFAAIFVIGFFILAYVLRDATDNVFITGVIETLKMGVVLILGYFFGSSKGSSDKNDLLRK
jgi:hypothetical protein